MAIISIASTKGGVGKTSLSFSLAKDMGYRYATNDMSIVLNRYKNARYYPNKIPLHNDTLYDFGGFESPHIDEILQNSDLIIIPTINDANSLLKTQMFIKKYSHKTILIVANMIENPSDAQNIKSTMQQYFENLAFTYIRRTKLLKNSLESGLSATELYNQNNQTRHTYKQSYKDYKKILDTLNLYR